MKKYLGIVKIYEEYMGKVNVILKSKTYDEELSIYEWFKLYPESEHVILENNTELDEMFEIFRDMTPITEEEKQLMEEAKVLYKKLTSSCI